MKGIMGNFIIGYRWRSTIFSRLSKNVWLMNAYDKSKNREAKYPNSETDCETGICWLKGISSKVIFVYMYLYI